MFKVTRLISFAADALQPQRAAFAERLLEFAGQELDGAIRSGVSAPHEHSFNGGDLVWQMLFESESAYRKFSRSARWRSITTVLSAAPVEHVDGVAYRLEHAQVFKPDIRSGIHRILLVAPRPGAKEQKVRQFEREMLEMPRYIPAIRNWAFSRVLHAEGGRRWTHVWEQDFDDLGGFLGPYLMHPIHFGHIDRWFDTQSQDFLMDTCLCSVLTDFETSWIAPG